MVVLSPSDSTRLFQLKAYENNDKPLTLPMIALSRDADMEIITTTRRPLTYDGGTINKEDHTSKTLNGIPIKLSYQLDIYCRYFAEADEYLRNFIFNFINYPRISITIPYNNSQIEHISTVLVESSVSDNSSIPERKIPGEFTRLTLKLYIDDAYIFSIPFMKDWMLEAGCDCDNPACEDCLL